MIQEKSSAELEIADFSNMFAYTIDQEQIPPSLGLLLEAIQNKPIFALNLNSNDIGVEAPQILKSVIPNLKNLL